jgi:hypothetical protein
MKVVLTIDEILMITPDTVAEAIALKHLFIKVHDEDWGRKIVIDSNMPESPINPPNNI